MKRIPFRKYAHSYRSLSRDAIAVIVVAGVGLLGAHFISASHASSRYISVETENGVIAGAANIVTTNTSASGGKYVQLGSVPLAVHVSGDHLINGSGKEIRLLGVDASGTEDDCVGGGGFSYAPLSSAEADAMASKWHINAVRIPMNEDCWLGINGAPAAYSGANYQTAIKNWVAALNNAGIIAILDLHWSAPGTDLSTGQKPAPDADHTPTFWTQVATAYKTNPAVIYDLFNEPYSPTRTPFPDNWACWLNGCTPQDAGALTPEYTTVGMQQLITTIRNTGASQPIMVGGLEAAGDPCGLNDTNDVKGLCREFYDLSGTDQNKTSIDPDDQLIVPLHNYGPSGTITGKMNMQTGWDTVEQAVKTYNIPLVTTELGEHDCTDNYINTYMDWADQNDVSYLAWSYEYNNQPTCNDANLQLVSSFDGTPSPKSAEAADYQAHLILENP